MNPNPYVNDLLEQPQALQNTLQALGDLPALQPIARSLRGGEISRVVLTGMGSSYHALHPLWLALVAEGIPAYQIETSELLHAAGGLLDERTLLVAVSQSGRSAEILHLLERRYGYLIAVTNTPGSPLAQAAGTLFLTRAGEEGRVSTRTYVTALAALAALGNGLLGGDPGQLVRAWAGVPDSMNCYLENWQAHVAEFTARLAGVQSLMLAGRGASLAAVGTGALIIKEAAHFPAEGMSSAALRHGPLNMASPALFALVYQGNGAYSTLNARLVEDIRAIGGKAALVGMGEEMGAVQLPPVIPEALPVMEILPAQMLSLACAGLTGWTAGILPHTGKVTTVE
jgi:glucosamine--fructose-6-phosphate aminotransferase (isomerizing)